METQVSKIVEGTLIAFNPGRHFRVNELFRLYLVRRLHIVANRRSLPRQIRDLARNYALIFGDFSGASFANTTENNIMKLYFNATAIANIADNAASSPNTNLFVSGHTADPGEAGDQTTSEVAYTSYARVSVARTSGGWTVTNNSVSPVAAITFPAGTGGSGTITHGAVGMLTSGAGIIIMSGTVTPNITCGNGITPSYPTSSTFTID